ncbi:MAG: DNA replication and repair protein RecF [Polyangiaceae bacterium]
MAAPNLFLRTLKAVGVRNLAPLQLEPAPKFNVLAGDNGQGKTSVLEAIYIVATSRSFRVPSTRDARTHGASLLAVEARIAESRGGLDPVDRVQSYRVERARASLLVNEQRPRSLSAYAVQSPVVVFHPDEIALSTGPATHRRKLMDRLVLYTRPSEAAAAGEYARALKARQELLKRADDGPELDAYEALAARAGAMLTRARRDAVEALRPHLHVAFTRIADPLLKLGCSYIEAGSSEEASAREELAVRRARDARVGSATFGPHRDDLRFELDGHAAREVASQGQHRALTLAIKAAESETIREATGLEPIHLLDDVSSELDAPRTRALFAYFHGCRGQLFLSTTRAELVTRELPEGAETALFHIERGVVSRAA